MALFGKPSQPSKQVPQKAPKPEPQTMFEKKEHWTRDDFKREAAKSPLELGGSGIVEHQRKEEINKLFPSGRFGTHISERDAKTRLRELRKEETFAKTYNEKARLGRLKSYLEKSTGLKGKY